jgi:hypothetical protein
VNFKEFASENEIIFIQYSSNEIIDTINVAISLLLEAELSLINIIKFIFEFNDRGSNLFANEKNKKTDDRFTALTGFELQFFIYSNIHQYINYNIKPLFDKYLTSIQLLQNPLQLISTYDSFNSKYIS